MKNFIAFFALALAMTSVNAATHSLTVQAGTNIGKGTVVVDAKGFDKVGFFTMTSSADRGKYTLFSGESSPSMSPKSAFIRQHDVYKPRH